MGRATIERDGDASIYRLPRNLLMVSAAVATIVVCAGLAALVLRSDGGSPTIWTWLLPLLVTIGFLPMIVNAVRPQLVRISDESLELLRWFGRQRIDWKDAIEAISYTDGQDLFLRIRTRTARILLSTRWSGWDASELIAIARHIDMILDAHPHVERPGPLDRFPSWFTKESGLVGKR